MATGMHADEIEVDVETVRRLLSRQFSDWAQLPIRRLDSSGTVNAMFRLGDDLVVRLPFVEHGAGGIEREAAWLPRLASRLPVAIPAVAGVGRPDDFYPCPWLVLSWLEGEHPVPGDTSTGLESGLAEFILAMRRIDTDGAPEGYRGGSFRRLDDAVRECLRQVADLVDADTLEALWSEALSAPEWAGPAVWVHCDLLAANLLLHEGRLSGVLDFATSGIGDPACDVMPAWGVLSADARSDFRDAVGLDTATWMRGRGWTLAQAAIALPYYRESNPMMAANSLRALTELAQWKAGE